MKAICNGAVFTVEKVSLLWVSLCYKLEWLFIYTIKNCVWLCSSVHMSRTLVNPVPFLSSFLLK